MKNRITLVGSLLLLIACNQEADKQETTTLAQTQKDTTVSRNEPVGFNTDSKLFIWKATTDYKKIKNTNIPAGALTADSLIKGLNELYENIVLEKVRISGDTIYTAIKDATYLSEQMGSSGAELYVADVVLNLTEVPGIKFVNIQMEEGSHMQPGVWSAGNFQKYIEAK